LDTLITGYNDGYSPAWQFLACSGDKATDFTLQLNLYDPTKADLATVSFFGNDLNFADIVSTCIIGYTKSPTCQELISTASNTLEGDSLPTLFYNIMTNIQTKAEPYKPRLQVYWTSYLQFFDSTDTTCDTDQFWVGVWPLLYKGELLTQALH
jgi:hypothetical protein